MKRFHILTVLLLLSWGISAQNHFDIVVVGGNPGGIMAAIAAARQGKTSVILERSQHIGGLPANGLGATDPGGNYRSVHGVYFQNQAILYRTVWKELSAAEGLQ